MGASRPGDIPGDPSAGFPYSLWVLRGSFAAVSLKVTEEKRSYSMDNTNLLTGAELGSVRPHYNLDLSAELPQPSAVGKGPPPFTCRLILPPASPLSAWCAHPSPVARDRNLCGGRPPNWPCALSIG